MKKLLGDAPALETIVQAILFRVYVEGKSVDDVIKSLDEGTWFEISEALGEVSDKRLIAYIVEQEADEVAELDKIEELKNVGSAQNLKVWVTKTVVGTLASLLLLLSGVMSYHNPGEVSEVIHAILSILGSAPSK